MAELVFNDVIFMKQGNFNPVKFSLMKDELMFEFIKTGIQQKLSHTDINTISAMYMSKGVGIRILMKNNSVFMFCGFTKEQLNNLSSAMKEKHGIQFDKISQAITGENIGVLSVENSCLSFKNNDKKLFFETPLEAVSNASLGKNELSLQFHQGDNVPVNLFEMRFHIDPAINPDMNVDILSKELLHDILKDASVIKSNESVIAEFEEMPCLTPRGKFNIKLHYSYIQLYGKTFDFKIIYSNIIRTFLLPHLDQRYCYYILNIDPPLRQGNTLYPYIIFQLSTEELVSVEIKVEKENKKLLELLGKQANSVVEGELVPIISQLIRDLSMIKITNPCTNYKSFQKLSGVSCSHKASSGILYPLEKALMFVYKPTILIRHEEIIGVNFSRGATSGRSFDLDLNLASSQKISFVGIDKQEYNCIYDYIIEKGLSIKNASITKVDKPIDEHVLDIYGGENKSESEDSESEDEEFEPNLYDTKKKNDESSDSSSEASSLPNSAESDE